jgi:asparagine synthase (glutamine-hydrolysing)
MAIVLGIYDPDNDRRARIRDRLPSSLSGLAHLTRRGASLLGLDIYWEASASTPVSVATDRFAERERMAVVVGDFAAPYAGTSDAAQRLLRQTAAQTPDFRYISGQDGYYLAILFDHTPRLVLGTDVLGLFPLYYWVKGDVCLFGTSPGLFKLHPLFVAEPSIYGIASVLLISHISGGQSLFKGVRRSSPWHFVEWTPEEGVRETGANPLRMSDASFDVPYQACLEQVASSFEAFHAPLALLPVLDVFLSGGQDSRMVAGYVGRYLSRKAVHAISLGRGTDQELQYAKKVSRTLGWRHRYHDVEFKEYPLFATSQLKLESLQAQFAPSIGTAQRLSAERGGPVICGFLGDLVIGDRHILAGRSQKTGEFDFAELFGNLNRYGFNINDAVELLSAHDGKLTVAQVIEDRRRDWDNIDALPFQKAWLYQMTHRQRFQIGSLIWRLSLGAWPLLPYYDRRLLDAVTSMPLNYLSSRRMQVDIIKREFPRLATLPLDRNAVGADYLVTPLYRKFLPSLSDVSWRLYEFLEGGRERRYYHRTYDFNTPAWRSVRREAERHRHQVGNLLDPEAVSRLLPAAETHIGFENSLVDTSKTKTLLGLVLWNGMNFGQP